jgi:hypothetical protein
MYCKKEKKVKTSILKDMHPTNDKIYKNLNIEARFISRMEIIHTKYLGLFQIYNRIGGVMVSVLASSI